MHDDGYYGIITTRKMNFWVSPLQIHSSVMIENTSMLSGQIKATGPIVAKNFHVL